MSGAFLRTLRRVSLAFQWDCEGFSYFLIVVRGVSTTFQGVLMAI